MRVAVIGAGVIGASAAKALQDRGAQVTIFDCCTPFMQGRSAGDWMLYRIAHRSRELVEAARDSMLLLEDWAGEAGQPMLRRNGLILTGQEYLLQDWREAMEAGRAAYEYRASSEQLNLPIHGVALPSLIDPAGGVILVDRVRRYLQGQLQGRFQHVPVIGVKEHRGLALVQAEDGIQEFDAVVVAAGENTNKILLGTELTIPVQLTHHFRFTFALKRPNHIYASWISRINDLITYQHPSAPGEWTIGVHMPEKMLRLHLDRAQAERSVRRTLQAYVRENLHEVSPKVLRVMYGTVHSDITDGYEILREGPIVTTYGDNLFKLAPHLGVQLAKTVMNEPVARSLILPGKV